MQAAIVKLLWEGLENGTPQITDDCLLEIVDAKTSRLVDIFRDCEAWDTMIQAGDKKGTRRLVPPKTP